MFFQSFARIIGAVLILSHSLSAIAQTFPVASYIETWSLSNDQQTIQAAILYDDLSQHKDPAQYARLLPQLDAHILHSDDARLQARLLMYKALWEMEMQPKRSPGYLPAVMQAIKQVYPLNDRQLDAELYALYGELCLRNQELETSLFYNLKSLDMQEAIGAARFPRIGWMYFSVARALYNTQEYAQAKTYALKCLEQVSHYKNVSPYDWIFLYDIIGAAYNKTNRPDSAAFYYRRIAARINGQDARKPGTDPAWSRFWLGLVNGYLGRIYLAQHQLDSARFLLHSAVQASIDFKELSDAASFLNNLAAIDYQDKKYALALSQWRQAYQWAQTSHDDQASMEAALGLGQVFRQLQQSDSAYHYYDRYHQLQDTLAALLSRSRLNVAQARIGYENIQDHLQQYQATIREQRRLRNFLIIGTLLLSVIGLLLYNRSRIRQRHKAQLSEERRRHAELEAAEAKDKLTLFRRHIIEKMELLQSMQPQPILRDTQPEFDISSHVLLTEEDWTRFKTAFSKAYPYFFQSLRQAITDISPAQERLSALLYLRLDNTQTAACLGISRDSVARSKRRLRDKLGLSSDAALEEYIYGLM